MVSYVDRHLAILNLQGHTDNTSKLLRSHCNSDFEVEALQTRLMIGVLRPIPKWGQS